MSAWCARGGAHHSVRRARPRPRLAAAERVEGRPTRRRRGAAAARRARRMGRAAAPARCHQQVPVITARWRMQFSPSSLPQRPQVARSSLLAAARKTRSVSAKSGRGSAGWRRRGRRCRERWRRWRWVQGAGSLCGCVHWQCHPQPWKAHMRGWHGALTCGGACGCSGESALGAVEEAMAEAERHGAQSEPLAALVAEASAALEQARAE